MLIFARRQQTTDCTEAEGEPSSQLQTVGVLLQQERQRQALGFAEVHAATRLSRTIFDAIEADAYDLLPVDAYAGPLVAMYARFLGLNGNDLACRFLQERASGQIIRRRRWWQRRRPVTSALDLAEPAPVSPATKALSLLAGIVLFVTLFCGYTGWNPTGHFVEQKRAPADPTAAFHPAYPGTSVEAAKAINLEARFLKDTEVVLQVDDGEAVRIIYTRASIASWEARSRLTIEFAEPASAVLRLNGRPLGFPPQSNGKHKLRLRAMSALPAAS